MTIAELDTRQAMVTELERQVATDKAQRWLEVERSTKTKIKLRTIKTRSRRKPSPTIPSYDGLTGEWASYYKVAQAYENKIPAQDRDDARHDIMIELDRATKRDGKPLPELRAYRIASLMVALYWRTYYRFATRICVYNGYPTTPKCKDCDHFESNNKRCIWLAVRPVASLDDEIVDEDGYRTRLLDTVASDKVEDMPDRWLEINELLQGLPTRLVEIAHKKLGEGIPLNNADKLYLGKWRKRLQKRLIT